MRVDLFDFELPESMIARHPSERRDASRLLVLKRGGRIEHRRFRDLVEYINEGDLLVLNNSKVVPARLTGRKTTGGRLEILLVKGINANTYEILSRGGYSGRLFFEDGLVAEIERGAIARFNRTDIRDYLYRYGKMPLPPYIKRQPDENDRLWYQTIYAEREGSIAAPTAGLHFTEELLSLIEKKGVIIKKITLHVGIGTFKPIRTDKIEAHRMDSEEFEVSLEVIDMIRKVKEKRGRVFAVGTTVTRTLESIMSGCCSVISRNGKLTGSTELFIYPGYRFRAVDALITNFHLPRSTPLMLASAFAGRERLLSAYEVAKAEGYRFFSYGDAMLII